MEGGVQRAPPLSNWALRRSIFKRARAGSRDRLPPTFFFTGSLNESAMRGNLKESAALNKQDHVDTLNDLNDSTARAIDAAPAVVDPGIIHA